MESEYNKLESFNETDFSELEKDNYEDLPEVDVKDEEAIFEIFKVNEYSNIITNIINSIDNYYQDMDAYDDYPYFRVQNSVKFIPQLSEKSEILTEKQLRQLHSHLPYYHQYKNLKLVYSTSKHGISLKTYFT